MKFWPLYTIFAFGFVITQIVGMHDQDKRIVQQASLLSQIQSLNTSAASQFVARWRGAYGSPDASDIADLTVLVSQIKANPSIIPTKTAAIRTEATLSDQAVWVFEWAAGAWKELGITAVVLLIVGFLFMSREIA